LRTGGFELEQSLIGGGTMGRISGWLQRFRNSGGWILLEYLLAIITLTSVYYAVQAERGAQVQASTLQEIAGSLSTRRLANFPENLPDITRMVLRARSCVEVWADVIGYAKFSAPAHFRDYQRALWDRGHANIPVIVHYYDEPTLLHQRLRQFQPDERALYPLRLYPDGKPGAYATSFGAFRASPRFQRYVSGLAPEEQQRVSTWTSFFQLLAEKDNQIESALKLENIRIDRYAGIRSIFVWMIDRTSDQTSEAVFTIAGDGGNETAFYTRDPTLLTSLYSIVAPANGHPNACAQ
jgi:hypothetical protein